jgi:imidazolonepropionase-like amidohydrolase
MNRLFVLIASLALAACAGGPTTEAGAGNLDIRCGVLIDGLANSAQQDRYISIRNERITHVAARPPPGYGDAAVLDLSDYTCLPGLIDTHVHIALKAEDSSDMTVYYRRTTAETTAIAEENAALTLDAGFTTVRNVGDYFPAVVLDMKRREEAGTVRSPRIQTAGPYLTIPGGGGDLVIPGVDESTIPPETRLGVARGPADFAAKAQAAIDAGADMIKVIASGAVFAFGGVPGAPEMTPEEIAAVVEVAHANGVRVTAHAHGARSIKEAILAGVDSIEHASLADDEAIELAAQHDVAFSMDVYNGTYTEEVGIEQGYPEEFMRKNEETTEAQRVAFEKAYARGVPIIYGTDAGVYPHGLNARQFEVMVERGMSAMDAIKAATSVAAKYMDLADDVGAIDVGRYGDLIAVRGNPLEDIERLQHVDVVIKSGTRIK